MSDTELVPTGYNLPATQDDKEFNTIAGNTYLPRLQLCGGNSDLCKTGVISIGSYAWIQGKDNAADLGKKVVAIVLAWRSKAVDMSEDIITSFDQNSAMFKSIKEKSEISDSKCMFGPEFLLYVPDRGFCTYHMASKTSRNTAPSVFQCMKDRKPVVLGSVLIEGKKHKWHGPTAVSSSTPLPSYPEVDEVNAQIQSFSNPPQSSTELAPEGEDRAL
jgi:hypothetical protein